MKKTNRRRRHLLTRFLLVVLALVILMPVIVTVLYSFFSPEEIRAFMDTRGSFSDTAWMDARLSPRMFSLSQYWKILIVDTSVLRMFMMSVFYTVMILLGQAVFVPMLAYALSRFHFKGRNVIFMAILLLMLLPYQVTMVPNVLTLRRMGLMNTVWAVILPLWFAPFYVFLLRQFMASLPGELFEAAQVDGAGTIRCYFHIALPVCRPAIGAALALSFADCWNLVEQPMTYLSQRTELQPLSVMFNQLVSESTGVEFAGAVIYMLPALFVYLYFLEDILSLSLIHI